jgi:transcriptional regulator with XRE-family HTH domain
LTVVDYINSRGLTPRIVCQKIGVTKQALSDYSNTKNGPTLKTLNKLAEGMTSLGAPTSVADLTRALMNKN